MNYMQDALKKKKKITVELEIDPDQGTAVIAEPMEDTESMISEGGDSEKESNEQKGMAPESKKVEEETKAQIEQDKEKPEMEGSMSEEEIASEFNDVSQGHEIGKPRSLQEALMKKASLMKGPK